MTQDPASAPVAAGRRGPAPWLIAALGVVLALTVLALYWPARSFDFVMFDDDLNIYNNPHLGEPTWQRISWMFTDTDYMPRFMPLGWLSLAGIFEGSGLDPAGYHLAGLVLHAINTLLVFTVTWQALALVAPSGQLPSDRGWRVFLALMAAAAWALHPLRVEPVAWATGLHYVHATCWALVAVAAAWARLSCRGKRRRAWLLASWLAYLGSVLVYPVTLGLPVALLAFELWLARRASAPADRPGWRRLAAEHAPYWLLAGFSLLATIHARWAVTGGFFAPAPSLGQFSLGQRLQQAAYCLVYYGVRPLVPGTPSPVYDMGAWRSHAGLCSLVVVAGAAGAAFCWRRWPGVGAWLAAFAGVSALYCGWSESPFQPSDRYTYFPSIALVLGGACLLVPLQSRLRRLALALVLLAWTGWIAAAVPGGLEKWRDSAHLFASIGAHLPAADFGLYESRQAVQLAARGEFAGAGSLLKRLRAAGAPPELLGTSEARVAELDRLSRWATQLPVAGGRVAPDALVAELNALQALRAGEVYTAGVRLRRALEIAPGFNDARYNLSLWLAGRGEIAGAFGQYLKLRGVLGLAAEENLLRVMAASAGSTAQPVWAELCARRLAGLRQGPDSQGRLPDPAGGEGR